jgi:hypothetical protein
MTLIELQTLLKRNVTNAELDIWNAVNVTKEVSATFKRLWLTQAQSKGGVEPLAIPFQQRQFSKPAASNFPKTKGCGCKKK